ncbi:aminotransferase class IV [Marinirhabdus gelatinilytica]|uniref:branched-chain-amino-acid transaminase n=1 Tax=Marinirhabdus gelatinilytica TaxID=1703343 RepID=A0A370QFR8_9FLAO|nr:aminotransferase class IV [Marinirhabdus gelatinilytica]RDK87218.1 branched-chain amino acid aminotransferase [Marinirhabdus gelatinilytica]
MVNHNTQLLSESETTISYANRGLNYGDAVFETLRVSAGKVLFWEDHYFRLMASMRIMRMEIPMTYTPEFLEAEILKTVEAEGQKNKTYRIKLLVWREEGGKYTPTAKDVSFCITTEILENPFYTISGDFYEVELFKDHYVTAGLLSTLKSNNRIINVLGSIYAQENDYANCLLLNDKRQVVEALNGNIFLVNGYKIKTPPLSDGCLNGILRKQIIKILGQVPDYILEEASVSPFELQKADEIFITNTIVGIQPISKYRKKEYGNTVAKELLQKLNVKARLG